VIEFIRKNALTLLLSKGYSQAQATKGSNAAADRYVKGGPFNGKAVDVCMAAAVQGLGKPEGKK
jgi:hypothetical protein